LLFAFGNSIRAIVGKTEVTDDLRAISWQAIVVGSIAELLVAVYGGYFGAGIGFMMLGMLAMLGMRDINAMGAIRTSVNTIPETWEWVLKTAQRTKRRLSPPAV
jgi:hypothetical protein